MPAEARGVVLYLHDEDGTVPETLPERLVGLSLGLVAPDGGRTWWSDRLLPEWDGQVTAERWVLERLLPWLESEHGVEPPAVGLLGVGMGGQGALRLAYKHPNTLPVAAAVSPKVDCQNVLEAGDPALRAMYRDGEDARQDSATLHIHPLNWPRNQWFCANPEDYEWFESSDRLKMKLFSLGVMHECDLETALPPAEYETVMLERAVDFVSERLERERLRVV